MTVHYRQPTINGPAQGRAVCGQDDPGDQYGGFALPASSTLPKVTCPHCWAWVRSIQQRLPTPITRHRKAIAHMMAGPRQV